MMLIGVISGRGGFIPNLDSLIIMKSKRKGLKHEVFIRARNEWIMNFVLWSEVLLDFRF